MKIKTETRFIGGNKKLQELKKYSLKGNEAACAKIIGGIFLPEAGIECIVLQAKNGAIDFSYTFNGNVKTYQIIFMDTCFSVVSAADNCSHMATAIAGIE